MAAKLTLGQKPTKSSLNTIGFGATADTMPAADIISAFNGAIRCPAWMMETVAKVQWQFSGPLTPANVQSTLGSQINILAGGPNPSGVAEVYTTPGLINGEFQTHVLALHVGVHLNTETMMYSAPGNAFAASIFATPGVAKPFSPDAWTEIDSANAWAGSTAPGSRAAMQFGWWANLAFYYMSLSYNLRWTYGSLVNILDEQLRYTAYMPTTAQEGSASSSQVDFMRMVRYMNDYYTGVLGSTNVFEPVDVIRQGSVNAGGIASGVSTYSPINDFLFSDVTVGGMDFRSLLNGNSEFRKLDHPYILKPGVPPGLIFAEQDTVLANQFRNQFDANSGLSAGAVPAVTTEISGEGTGFGSGYQERTLDGAVVTQHNPTGITQFKGGNAFMSVEIKGPEISEWLACQIRDNPGFASQILSGTGTQCTWAN